jgi:hypothetical protein
MENSKITICLTSCGRFDLLERTVKSLVENWDGPKPKLVRIHEDSGIIENRLICHNTVHRYLIDFAPFVVLEEKFGQIGAIDSLYQFVETPYIFHCEDDFEFYKPGFIQPSIDILENNPNIMQVWLREPNDRNRHPATGKILQTPNRTKFQMLAHNYRSVWSGFSFNPGLRRLSDYQKVGPYSNLTTFNPKSPLDSEIAVGQAYLRAGFRAATLLTGYCKHIGTGRHCN